MKKSITIRIPKPCHEDWAKMTDTEKGKFCNVCSKEVFDLTSKTDEELVKILTKSKNACGRMKKSQLNREVKLERKSGQSLAPLAASILVPLTLLSNNPKSNTNSISKKPMISMGIGRFNNTNNLRLSVFTKGIVTDGNGNPLRNVEITSDETETQTWTNKKGEYEIYTLDKEWLTFSKENYETQIIRLRKNQIENALMESKISTHTVLVNTGMIAIEEVIEVKKDFLITITKGMVTDNTGLPLPGVNVILKSTKTGAQTDFDGNYKIETKPGDILVFSYIGFETKEITVSNISYSINIIMNANTDMLTGEVVIVAGGISYEAYQPTKDAAWKERRKQVSDNFREFEKIKQERKKVGRKKK